jgi:hypothetical protein
MMGSKPLPVRFIPGWLGCCTTNGASLIPSGQPSLWLELIRVRVEKLKSKVD